MHEGSCEMKALFQLVQGCRAAFKTYLVIHLVPLILFRRKKFKQKYFINYKAPFKKSKGWFLDWWNLFSLQEEEPWSSDVLCAFWQLTTTIVEVYSFWLSDIRLIRNHRRGYHAFLVIIPPTRDSPICAQQSNGDLLQNGREEEMERKNSYGRLLAECGRHVCDSIHIHEWPRPLALELPQVSGQDPWGHLTWSQS